MIKPQTRLKVADNTGIKILMCIRVMKGSQARFGRVGDQIVGSVKSCAAQSDFKKGQVVSAVIARQRQPIRRQDGTWVRFDDNAAIIVDKNKKPKGSRIIGPVSRELREAGYKAIISMAPEVI